MLGLPREALEELVARARRDEDKIRAEHRLQRRLGFRTWCMAESECGMRALSGHDGWSVGRMRQWPLAVWSCIVE